MSGEDFYLKLRLARLLTRQGYFVRRNVPISTYTPGEYGAKRVDITDIDVLGLMWDEDFARRSVACECKSGTQARPLDRIFWLGGVMKYFQAETGYLLTKETGNVSRSIGRSMGIQVLGEDILSNLEKRIGINSGDWLGSCNPDVDGKIVEYRKIMKQAFQSQTNYVVYTYWKDQDYNQVKRLITTGREIGKKMGASDASKWFAIELLCLFSSSLVTFCNRVHLAIESELQGDVSSHLYGGVSSKTEQLEYAKSAIQYLKSVARDYFEQKLPLSEEDVSMDPEYLGKLAELLSRLVSKPGETRLLPLFLDIVSFEYLLKGKAVSKDRLDNQFRGHDVFLLAKLAKNIIDFYVKTTSIQSMVFEPLLEF